jgi:Leucine-rich repeat (LRR) protein
MSKIFFIGIFMKYFLLVWTLLFAVSAFSQDMDVTQIKKRMAEIRKTADWDNPAAAKKANDEIKELSKKLMLSGKNQNPANESDSLKLEQVEENIDYKLKLLGQIYESVKQGENADILLGKPIREEIAEEYKEDESPKNITPEFFKEMSVLVIDLSIPTVQRTIDVMQNYKSIKTLIITSGKYPLAVNLQDLLMKASKYPLENLYILNFDHFVTRIPEQITQFSKLSTLGLFNNKISQLPQNINSIKNLDSLFLDINPISTLFPAINSMKNLKVLGVAQTSISEAEIKKIKELLPNCEVKIK